MNQKGFTLLEVMIAIAILVIAFSSIYSMQFNTLRSMDRSKTRNVVGMLAHGAMAQTEIEMKDMSFSQMKTEESAAFDAPYQNYKWTRKIKEIKFPVLNFADPGGDDDKDSAPNPLAERISKMVSETLNKSIREVSITVEWEVRGKKQEYVLATYWMDFSKGVDLGL